MSSNMHTEGPMLVRFDCGCRGVRLPSGESWVLWACDQNYDDPEYTAWRRGDLDGKSVTPMGPERVRITLEAIGEAFAKAEAYDRLCESLKAALK